MATGTGPTDLGCLVRELRRLLQELLRALPSTDETNVPLVRCRAVRVSGGRCKHTSWTASLSADQLCRAHTNWVVEGRGLMRSDPTWPEVGLAAGLELLHQQGTPRAASR